MTKPNTTRSANINVLADRELTQVVGGYCHRRRYRHCGGWYKPRHESKYDKSYEYSYSSEDSGSESYETSDSYETTGPSGNQQIVNVAVTVNIAQVQR